MIDLRVFHSKLLLFYLNKKVSGVIEKCGDFFSLYSHFYFLVLGFVSLKIYFEMKSGNVFCSVYKRKLISLINTTLFYIFII